jgi:hypothetical protein
VLAEVIEGVAAPWDDVPRYLSAAGRDTLITSSGRRAGLIGPAAGR